MGDLRGGGGEGDGSLGQHVFECAQPTHKVHLQSNEDKVLKQNPNVC